MYQESSQDQLKYLIETNQRNYVRVAHHSLVFISISAIQKACARVPDQLIKLPITN